MRALGRLVLARGGPRDLQALGIGLRGGEAVRARLSNIEVAAGLPGEINAMLTPLTCFGSDEASKRLAQLVGTLHAALGDTLPVWPAMAVSCVVSRAARSSARIEQRKPQGDCRPAGQLQL